MKEAVAVAAEACAADTKSQTCYICTEAVHWKTKEGLVRGCSCRGTAGFAHVSCLAEQAKILVGEVEESNLGDEAKQARWKRWQACSLCKQKYHGVVKCALGWACWKTYLGRPEGNRFRRGAMTQLGNSLSEANRHEDALSVQEAELATNRRLGAAGGDLLVVQSNLATTYQELGRLDEAISLQRDVYSGYIKFHGEEHGKTLVAANHYATSLVRLDRFEEARTLVRKTLPVARRVLGESDARTLRMRWLYANALYGSGALDDIREAVETLESVANSWTRVFGNSHPETLQIKNALATARATLRAREMPPAGSA